MSSAGSGTAEVQATAGLLQSAQLEAGLDFFGFASVVPSATSVYPVIGISGQFALWPVSSPTAQTIARQTSGRLGAAIPLFGYSRVCLFGTSCANATADLSIFLNSGNEAVGFGGAWTVAIPGDPNVYVTGAPWTTGTADAGMGVTAMGFARGPDSNPGSTARSGGQMNLVTPIFVRSVIGGNTYRLPGVATLALEFTSDAPACNNGDDDDGDGLGDYPADPGCVSGDDPSEKDASLACDDGIDNDGDGFIDDPADPGCFDPAWAQEDSKCQNGLDDDGDGAIDFDGGASVHGGTPIAAPDPQCGQAHRNREAPSSCGLGAEVALALAGLVAWRRRRGDRSGRGSAIDR
ncbi:MAG: hypothetical protein DCC71_01255 [Proteobacteria bacterium]|nr:MAG: hypothetical protein DCC71_01255 [Pseudomonadota bacterium]